MLAMNDDLTCLSLDAINAFGSVDRSKLYDLIKQKILDMLQWFLFITGDGIQVQFAAINSLKLLSGMIQGLTSSNLHYNQRSNGMYNSDHLDRWKKITNGYVDDGLQLILDEYVSFHQILISVYANEIYTFIQAKTP